MSFPPCVSSAECSRALWAIGKGRLGSSWGHTFSSSFFTARRLIPLRQLLGSLASSPRVVQCADTVPVLLELFFSVVSEVSTFWAV